jgi:2-iminobutanoate/2-iminopropanoate deaminase
MSSPGETFNPAGMWQPFGPFSMAVVQGDGRIVHLKGQVALDDQGRVVGRGDMRAQTRRTLQNIQIVLAAVGGEMRDVICLTHHVTDIEQFLNTADIRREFFAEPFPATTTVEVARLFNRDLLVEIGGVAEIPRDRFRRAGRLAGR